MGSCYSQGKIVKFGFNEDTEPNASSNVCYCPFINMVCNHRYHINALANRTTFVDNYIGNQTHLAKVGAILCSPEHDVYPQLREMRVIFVKQYHFFIIMISFCSTICLTFKFFSCARIPPLFPRFRYCWKSIRLHITGRLCPCCIWGSCKLSLR